MTDEITTAAEAEARLDEVVEVLSGDDVEARAAMLDALADVAPDLSPEAVETLVPHVARVVEADGRDRWPGLRFVGDAASTHTDELVPLVEPLVSVCVSPTASPGQAGAAVETIASLRPAADDRLDTLVRALVDDVGEDPSERRFDADDGDVAEGLGLLAWKVPSAVVPVADEVSLLAATGDDWTRQCATGALVELVEAGVPLDRDVVNRLIGRLDDDEPQTRLRAVEAVVPAVEQRPRTPSDAFDLPATLDRLAADDPDERVREAAAEARAALLEGDEGTDSAVASAPGPPMRRVSPADGSSIDQDAVVQFRDADPDPDAVQYYLELDAVAEPYVGVAVAETDDGETAIGVALPADEGVWAERFGTTVTDTPETDEASAAGDEGEDSTVRHRDDGAEASTDESGTIADRRPDPSTVDAPYVDVDYDDLVEEEVIGIGGNADVMKATLPAADGDSDGDVTLAIKRPRMQGTLHADAVERLLSEAETWDKLDDHDHVVSVVDYGAEPLPWIAMEHVDGGDLSERAGDLNFEQALWTAVAITRGVRHAHNRGVVHLDLKPTNVLFREVEGAWDVPKIADWGLSKHLLDHSKSVDGLSPQYAAPEQFDADRGPVDDVTDVYQVGALLYELFTGQPPFDGDPAGAMHGALHETPTPPSEGADLPPALDDVLLTALAKSRDDRYEDVLYLRDALRELQDLDEDTERGELPDPGDIVVGTVDEIVEFGAFVDFKDHAGRGLVHVSEIANGWSKAVSDHVTEGERVVAKVVGVDEDAGHVDLSLTEVD